MSEARYYLRFTTPDGVEHSFKASSYEAQRIPEHVGVSRNGYGWGKKARLMAMEPGDIMAVPVISMGDRSGWASLASKIKHDSIAPGSTEPEIIFHVSRPGNDNLIIITRER